MAFRTTRETRCTGYPGACGVTMRKRPCANEFMAVTDVSRKTFSITPIPGGAFRPAG